MSASKRQRKRPRKRLQQRLRRQLKQQDAQPAPVSTACRQRQRSEVHVITYDSICARGFMRYLLVLTCLLLRSTCFVPVAVSMRGLFVLILFCKHMVIDLEWVPTSWEHQDDARRKCRRIDSVLTLRIDSVLTPKVTKISGVRAFFMASERVPTSLGF